MRRSTEPHLTLPREPSRFPRSPFRSLSGNGHSVKQGCREAKTIVAKVRDSSTELKGKSHHFLPVSEYFSSGNCSSFPVLPSFLGQKHKCTWSCVLFGLLKSMSETLRAHQTYDERGVEKHILILQKCEQSRRPLETIWNSSYCSLYAPHRKAKTNLNCEFNLCTLFFFKVCLLLGLLDCKPRVQIPKPYSQTFG